MSTKTLIGLGILLGGLFFCGVSIDGGAWLAILALVAAGGIGWYQISQYEKKKELRGSS